MKIEGVARDYRSIALQADMFNSTKGLSFKNVVFSNLVKDKNNNIIFDLKFNVDPALLSYEKNNLLDNSTATTSVPPVNNIVPTITNTATPTTTNPITTTSNTTNGSPEQNNLENNKQ